MAKSIRETLPAPRDVPQMSMPRQDRGDDKGEGDPYYKYAWSRWSLDVPITLANVDSGAESCTARVELRVRATDASGIMQPPSIAHVFAKDGYLCNAQHVISVDVTVRGL